jgi:RNA-directed DNA polymerase
MMHGHEKSDPAIVAVKPANKAEQPAAEQSAAELTAAEPVEPRAGTKGNAGQQTMPWAQSQTSMPHALERIRKVARERKKEKFISLFHHISVELLEEAFYELKADAAPGVDRLTWKDYEANLERNLEDLHDRVLGERIGRCRADGSTYPSRTANNVRSRSLPWRTRSSNGQWSRC